MLAPWRVIMIRRFPPPPYKPTRGSSAAFSLAPALTQFKNPASWHFPLLSPLHNPIEHCRASFPPSSAADNLSPFGVPDGITTFNRSIDDHPCELSSNNYGHLPDLFAVLRSGDFDVVRVHGRIITSGLRADVYLCNTLINSLVNSDDLGYAQQVFDEMLEKNVVSWTCLMTGYVRCGKPDDACNLFRDMLREGFKPTHFSFGSALRACQDLRSRGLALGAQIHGLIWKMIYTFDIVVCNALISMYGNCCGSSSHDARRVFDEILTNNSISWNSMISIYSQKGDIFSAFELFFLMQGEGSEFGIRPNEYTYGSLVSSMYSGSSVSSNAYLCTLEQMLSQVTKNGFLSDLYVGSALVSAFARLGFPSVAKEVFEGLAVKNAVSANGLMVGLVKQNRGKEALQIFRDARELVTRNHDSYVVLLSACAEAQEEGSSIIGRELHGLVLRNGMIVEKVGVGNGLVNMYAKCGYVDKACRVFEQMEVKDLVSWNSMISGLDQNGCFKEAIKNFLVMRKAGIVPSNFTLISTLSSCRSLGLSILGCQMHSEGIKLGLDFDVSVTNSLLDLYAESGSISDCCKLFSLMPGRDQVSWNSMIGVLANSKDSILRSMDYFMAMVRNGLTPNRVTFINIFSALSSLSCLDLVQQIHALVIKLSLSEDSAVENALLSCYAKCGELNACEHIFHYMSERRDNISWNSILSGYIQHGLLEKASDFLWFMIQQGQKLDGFTISTVLCACASIAALGRGMEVHAYGIRACLKSDVVVESALVDMYSKCGRVDYAAKVFGSMSRKNEFSWNSMISGYARHGQGEKALKTFDDMEDEGRRPDQVTFVGLLSACSHFGLVDQGKKYFESMEKLYGLAPRMEHYSCMIDILGRAGELDEIEVFIAKMPVEPNALVWRTVIAACSRTKNPKLNLGKKAADMLLELEPQNPVNYVLISNFYASRGRWEDVSKARSLMRRVPMKKEAGSSWVTMKDGVHVFVAGDKSHPETDAIYAQLKLLNEKLRNCGYVPQTKFVLYDLDVENKEELLSNHSERLAVAFVLIRTTEIPIRIMKNLRVCGDCHSAFCYISQIVSRQIILRDSNRFHHFSDGKCSCGDYW